MPYLRRLPVLLLTSLALAAPASGAAAESGDPGGGPGGGPGGDPSAGSGAGWGAGSGSGTGSGSGSSAGSGSGTGGAELAANIFEGFLDFGPRDFTQYGGELFFATTTGGHAREHAVGAPETLDPRPGLYAYDAVTGRTRVVGTYLPDPHDLTVYDGKLYFSASDGAADTLWSYDAATGRLAEVPSPDYPASLTVHAGKLYFSAQDAQHGRELWAYDSSTGLSELAADIASGEASSWPGQASATLTTYAGRLYFSATADTATGTELWSYDPTTGTAELAADIRPGPGSSVPSWPTVYADRLYFGADDGMSGAELWAFDAADGSAERVADVNRGAAGSSPGAFDSFEVYDDRLFFSARAGEVGTELFSYDAATDRVRLAVDVMPGRSGSNPTGLTGFDGQLFFFAVEAGSSGYSLLAYDGTTGAVSAVDGATGCPYLPAALASYSGSLYFCGTDAEHGEELWRYVPAEQVTLTVTPQSPVVVGPGGGTVEFQASVTNSTDRSQTVDLWTAVVRLPGYALTGPLTGPRTVTIEPGATFGPVVLRQTVPASAPAGRYLLRAHGGEFPEAVVASGGFLITKAA